MTAPASPCTRVCRIDARSGWCLGCRRTLAEIAEWPVMTAERQRALLSALARRR